jgi:hypothetical protein
MNFEYQKKQNFSNTNNNYTPQTPKELYSPQNLDEEYDGDFEEYKFYKGKDINIYRLWLNKYSKHITWKDFQVANQHFDINSPAEGQIIKVPKITSQKEEKKKPTVQPKQEKKEIKKQETKKQNFSNIKEEKKYEARQDKTRVEKKERFFNPSVVGLKKSKGFFEELLEKQPNESAKNKVSSKKDEENILYKSQRDNNYSKYNPYGNFYKTVSGDTMCNVTTLAMQLIAMNGTNEDIVKKMAINILINELKGKTSYKESDRDSLMKKQLEDLIMLRFEQLGSKFFENKGMVILNAQPHEILAALGYVGTEFSEIASKYEVKGLWAKKENYQKELGQLIKDKKATVLLSNSLTRFGHICLLVDIKEDGIIINDPYGAVVNYQGHELPNGNVAYKTIENLTKKEGNENLKNRFKYNTSNYKKFLSIKENKKDEIVSNIGEKNFYSWEEVKKYQIGDWVMILHK